MEIVFLNGPPRAGKDEFAKLLESEFGYCHVRMASPLREVASMLFGLSTDAEYERWKAESGREFMIRLSEDVIKPLFGPEWFGQRLGQTILEHHSIKSQNKFVVSDAGFDDEIRSLVEVLISQKNGLKIKAFQIHRDGTSFASDSRSWVNFTETLGPLGVDVKEFLVKNPGTSIEDFRSSVRVFFEC